MLKLKKAMLTFHPGPAGQQSHMHDSRGSLPFQKLNYLELDYFFSHRTSSSTIKTQVLVGVCFVLFVSFPLGVKIKTKKYWKTEQPWMCRSMCFPGSREATLQGNFPTYFALEGHSCFGRPRCLWDRQPSLRPWVQLPAEVNGWKDSTDPESSYDWTRCYFNQIHLNQVLRY